MKKKQMAVWLLTLLFSPLAALSQTTRDDGHSPTALPEVVVTGTRTAEEIQKVPASISVITAADIQRSSAKTAVDLLRREEGIVVRDLLGNGKAAQVDLRGFGETASSNTLVLVDGRRTNEIDLSGVDWAQIPVEQIERIEVLRGPGSVLYGDNAAAGVINIITKSPAKKFTAGGASPWAATTATGSMPRPAEGTPRRRFPSTAAARTATGTATTTTTGPTISAANSFGMPRTGSGSTCPDPITRTASACREP